MLKINLKINKNKGIFADGACEYMKHLREELRNFGYDVSTGFGSEGGYLNYYLFAKINDKDAENSISKGNLTTSNHLCI